jgi:hypothetical protein
MMIMKTRCSQTARMLECSSLLPSTLRALESRSLGSERVLWEENGMLSVG